MPQTRRGRPRSQPLQQRPPEADYIRTFFETSAIPNDSHEILLESLQSLVETVREQQQPEDQPLSKIYLTKGLYCENSGPSRRKTRNNAFPLPLHNGLKLLNTQKDFRLPWNIYCPTSNISRLPDWRPIKKSIWIDVAYPTRPKGQKLVCACTERCDDNCLNRLQRYECDPTVCPFEQNDCGNRAIQTLEKELNNGRAYARGFEIVWTGEKGYGLRAVRSYAPGELIIEYTGDVISPDEVQNRLKTQYAKSKNYYFLSLENGYVIDSGIRGSAARFVNHSCAPNCEMQKWYVKDVPRIGLFAGPNPIPAGTELTYDYNFDWFPGATQQICHCSSENCRGVIGRKSAGVTRPSSPVDKTASKRSLAKSSKTRSRANAKPITTQPSTQITSESQPVPVKRGRGRPRKHPIDPNAPRPQPKRVKTSKLPAPSERVTRRGRPPTKNVKSKDSSSEISVRTRRSRTSTTARVTRRSKAVRTLGHEMLPETPVKKKASRHKSTNSSKSAKLSIPVASSTPQSGTASKTSPVIDPKTGKPKRGRGRPPKRKTLILRALAEKRAREEAERQAEEADQSSPHSKAGSSDNLSPPGLDRSSDTLTPETTPSTVPTTISFPNEKPPKDTPEKLRIDFLCAVNT
uniref:ARAD1D04708p n=1 Tax=Blastobotrys adeninivorans TaxID=409370 RepID=A0A060TD66_BLAAD